MKQFFDEKWIMKVLSYLWIWVEFCEWFLLDKKKEISVSENIAMFYLVVIFVEKNHLVPEQYFLFEMSPLKKV